MKPATIHTLLGLITVLASPGLLAQRAPQTDYTPSTLVVFNKNVPESKELADFYAQARGIPREQVVGLNCANKETITRAEFQKTIENPLRTRLITLPELLSFSAPPK